MIAASAAMKAEIEARALAQRMDALRRADEIRVQRAQLKRDLKAGRANIFDVMLNPPDFMESIRILELLMSVPKVGRVKGDTILRKTRVSPTKRLDGLSERQRAEIISMLRR